MGRKNRDNRMGILKESVEHGRAAVKPDRARKHKGAHQPKPLRQRISCCFSSDLNRAIKARARTIAPASLSPPDRRSRFQRDFFKIGHQASAPGTALRSRSKKSSLPTLPGQTTTWNIALSEWIWLHVARRSQPERGAHGPDDEQTTPRYHQPHIFAPERFFTCVWPSELSAPAGPCAPTPITSNESFTLPAFSNSSMSGTLSPCLSGFLRSISIR